MKTPAGLVEDNIPEDQSLVINTAQGLILISGCGHAGIINTLTMARDEFANEPVYAVLGGFHLFPASDTQVDWTADKLKEFGTSYLMGAHCTGIESVYRIRQRLGLPRVLSGRQWWAPSARRLCWAKAFIPEDWHNKSCRASPFKPSIQMVSGHAAE